MEYMVFIQSFSRPKTLKKMLKDYPCLKKSTLVLTKGDPYLESYPESFDKLVIDSKDISYKKQAIIDYCVDLNIKKAILLDDDLKFAKRQGVKKAVPCTNDNVEDLIALMVEVTTKNHPLSHPINRFMFQTVKERFSKNRPAIRAVCLYVPTILKEGIKYTGLNTCFMSDRYMQLSLLSKGYRTVALGEFTVDDYGTNKPGGCSGYRTSELQSEAAIKLKKAFPEQVKLKVKSNGLWTERRYDCTLYLKKFLDKNESRKLEDWELEE